MLRQLASNAATQRMSRWTPRQLLPRTGGSSRQLRVSVCAQVAKLAPPEETAVLVESGHTYVDVRTPEEFAAGRPPGSVNIPFMLATSQGMAPNPEFVQSFKAAFPDPASELVVGCKSGRRSAAACAVLAQENYSHLVDNAGGWDGWVAAGLPVEK